MAEDTEKEYRPSLTETPQFATPAAGENIRESRISTHVRQRTGSMTAGIFTSSPNKNEQNADGQVAKPMKPLFDMDNDPDRPHDAINQSVIVE